MGTIHINRHLLNDGIQEYFIAELKKEFKEDFSLVATRVHELIPFYSIKEVKELLRLDILRIKYAQSKLPKE